MACHLSSINLSQLEYLKDIPGDLEPIRYRSQIYEDETPTISDALSDPILDNSKEDLSNIFYRSCSPTTLSPILTSEARFLSKIGILHPALPLSQQALLANKLKEIQNSISPEIIDMATSTKKALDISFSGVDIQISNRGTIRFKVKEIGEGSFKSTNLVVQLAKSEELINRQPIIFEALSTTGIRNISNQSQIDNEVFLHNYLKKLKKSNPTGFAVSFSHVCSAKKIVKTQTSEVGIITEFCNGGTVNELIKNSRTLSLEEQYCIIGQMAKGVSQLHAVGIVHRDLKLDNFLVKLDSEGGVEQIKIADLGLSSLIEVEKRYYPKFIPYTHCPPEYRGCNKDGLFDPKSDVYQLGISCIGIFSKLSDIELSRKTPIEFDSLIKALPNETLKTFILRMINLNPAERPTMVEVMEFFENSKIALKVREPIL